MAISFQLRLRAYERDRYTCVYCKTPFDRFSPQLTLDHSDPAAGDAFENVVTCCRSCNNKKGASTPIDFFARGMTSALVGCLKPSSKSKKDTEMATILAAAAARFHMLPTEIVERNNSTSVVKVRRWVAIQARTKGISLPRIGNCLRRHHTTVINLLK